MKRTDAIQALRERFTNTDGTVLPPGLSIISQEEAAALGVFDQEDDGWIEWGGGQFNDELPNGLDSEELVNIKFSTGRVSASAHRAGDVDWPRRGISSDIIAYRIHREG